MSVNTEVQYLYNIIYCTYCNYPIEKYSTGLPLAMKNKVNSLLEQGNTSAEVLSFFKATYGVASVKDNAYFYLTRINDAIPNADVYLVILSIFISIFLIRLVRERVKSVTRVDET